MNVPNLITLSRLAVTVACFACLISAPPEPETVRDSAFVVWVAFWLFVFAGCTDFLDGYLARRWDQVTRFGRVADPFADKVLVCGSLILMLQFPEAAEIMPAWFVVVIMAREFLVTTIRGLAESSGMSFGADRLGKYKMVAQCGLAVGLMACVASKEQDSWAAFYYHFTIVAKWVTLVLTLWSGIGYVWKARKILFGQGV